MSKAVFRGGGGWGSVFQIVVCWLNYKLYFGDFYYLLCLQLLRVVKKLPSMLGNFLLHVLSKIAYI